MPKGTPTSKPSEQTQRLLDALADIEERLAAERHKDHARALLGRFIDKHGLSASDLREAAKNLVARKVGGAPVVSHNIGKAKQLALGRALRKAREAKGIPATHLVKLIGAKSSGAVAMWERGMLPSMAKYRDGLTKHLDLPKDFFAEVPLNRRLGYKKANGAAAH